MGPKKRKLETTNQMNSNKNIKLNQNNNNEGGDIKVEKWNQLFNSVWKNIVLFKLIFNHVRIFKKNERVTFKELKELKEYPERNYIDKIIYIGKSVLKKGDLPIDGVLKDLSIHFPRSVSIKGDSIPDGVEILRLGYHGNKVVKTPPFSTLPKSIHTIKDAMVIKNIDSNQLYEIPSNITSISFYQCLNISGDNKSGNGFITIPNTIKELEFGCAWNNEGIPLKKGDLPIGLEKLTLYGYKQFSSMDQIGILPPTLKELTIKCIFGDKIDGLFDILPNGIESLELIDCICVIKPDSNLNKLTSLKKLSIQFDETIDIETGDIEPLSLPSSLTDLSITNLQTTEIKPNTIPSSVTSLNLNVESEISKDSLPPSITSLVFNRPIEILPPSLTHLELTCRYPEEDEMNSMISIFPSSLKSIKLNSCLEDLELEYPSTITVEYDDY